MVSIEAFPCISLVEHAGKVIRDFLSVALLSYCSDAEFPLLTRICSAGETTHAHTAGPSALHTIHFPLRAEKVKKKMASCLTSPKHKAQLTESLCGLISWPASVLFPDAMQAYPPVVRRRVFGFAGGRQGHVLVPLLFGMFTLPQLALTAEE